MKLSSILFILLSCFTTCHQKALTDNNTQVKSCIGGGGDLNAFENLFKKKAVEVSAITNCKELMAAGRIDDGDLRRFNPTDVCNTGVERARLSNKIVAYTDIPAGQDYQSCEDGPAGKAYYLAQDPNKSTYMMLDNTRAHWLFTNKLSGCDMFVAIDAAGTPLVIHANQDRHPNCAENFKAKQDNTDAILRAHPGFTLRARLNPMKGSALKPYWNRYKVEYCHVIRQEYDIFTSKAQEYIFFGHYNTRKAVWQFYFKGVVNGNFKRLY